MICVSELPDGAIAKSCANGVKQKKRLLMGCLGARRNHLILFPRAACAIAHSEDMRVGFGLERCGYIDLIDFVDRQTIQRSEAFGSFDTSGPNCDVGRNTQAPLCYDRVLFNGDHRVIQQDVDTQITKSVTGSGGYIRWQRGQNARTRFEQRDTHSVRSLRMMNIELVQNILHAPKLRSQFDAGSTSTNDDDASGRWCSRFSLCSGLCADVEQPTAKALCLRGGIQSDGVFFRPGDAKEMRLAAKGKNQGVICEIPRGQDKLVWIFRIRDSGNANHAPASVQTYQFAMAELERVPTCMRSVSDLVSVRVEGTGGDFVQERLPDMGCAPVNKRYVSALGFPQVVAQACCQFESTCAPTNDHNAVHGMPLI
jgi:hypothetical protein